MFLIHGKQFKGKRGYVEVFYNPKIKGNWTEKEHEAMLFKVGLNARDMANYLIEKERRVKYVTVRLK